MKWFFFILIGRLFGFNELFLSFYFRMWNWTEINSVGCRPRLCVARNHCKIFNYKTISSVSPTNTTIPLPRPFWAIDIAFAHWEIVVFFLHFTLGEDCQILVLQKKPRNSDSLTFEFHSGCKKCTIEKTSKQFHKYITYVSNEFSTACCSR